MDEKKITKKEEMGVTWPPFATASKAFFLRVSVTPDFLANSSPFTTQCRIFTQERYIAVENIVRKGEIACNKQLILLLLCFLPYMALIFHSKCTLTLSQTANFRLLQMERVCRQQFKI